MPPRWLFETAQSLNTTLSQNLQQNASGEQLETQERSSARSLPGPREAPPAHGELAVPAAAGGRGARPAPGPAQPHRPGGAAARTLVRSMPEPTMGSPSSSMPAGRGGRSPDPNSAALRSLGPETNPSAAGRRCPALPPGKRSPGPRPSRPCAPGINPGYKPRA